MVYKICNEIEKVFDLRSGIVMTPNSEQVVRSYFNPSYREMHLHATLNYCDSGFLKWVYNVQNNEIKRITGVDILEFAVEKYINDTYIIGGSDDCISYFGQDKINTIYLENWGATFSEVVQIISSRSERYIFLSISSPKQEMLAIKLSLLFQTKVFICVGNAANFVSGESKRFDKLNIPGSEAIFRSFSSWLVFKRAIKTLPIFIIIFLIKFRSYDSLQS